MEIEESCRRMLIELVNDRFHENALNLLYSFHAYRRTE